MPIGQGSALTPFPFGVTLKGLGVNPRVRGLRWGYKGVIPFF
jgi:hypothetical protein